jgi:hypothetical protein
MLALQRTHNLIDEELEKSDVLTSLQSPPVSESLFKKMMSTACEEMIKVFNRQFKNYLDGPLSDPSQKKILQKQLESAPPHNMAAESIIVSFSYSKKKSPSATVQFISSSVAE